MPLQKRKGIPRLKLKARIASKVMEKDLKAKAKLLMDDPELIFPDCAADCGSCPFRKTKKGIEKIQKFKDNPVKLAKLARKGDRLARAYAATIALVHEEKTPYLATSTYPAGTIAYAQRGKTDKEKLIGVQYFDSPKWRVMSVVDLVHNKGLHFYSYGDNFVCTGKEAAPPEEYVKLAAESVGANKIDDDKFLCPHNPEESNHIEFDWITAGKKILLCDQCATRAKNTLKKLAEGMAVPRVLSEFEIAVKRPLKVVSGKSECADLLDRSIHADLLEDYSNGKLGDKELIDKHLEEIREDLVKVDRKVYVRGERCYGEDADAFVKDVTQDPVEARALLGLLSDIGHPVVVDTGDSVNDLLKREWADHGRNALKALVPEKLADKYFKEDETADSPIKVIRKALKEAEHEEISSRIPKYTGLSKYGEFVDEVVRAYKTGGQSSSISVLDSEKSNDHRIRSISHSFYLALGVTAKSWRFTDEEKEYGKHLMVFAKKLLESSSDEEHHSEFTQYLREAGCAEEVKRV